MQNLSALQGENHYSQLLGGSTVEEYLQPDLQFYSPHQHHLGDKNQKQGFPSHPTQQYTRM